MSQRTRTWAGCTLNNPTDEEIQDILNLTEDAFKWAIFAKEAGEEGTTHLQAAWSLKNGKSLSAMKSFLGSARWHLEPIAPKSTQYRAYAYCLKGEQPKVEWDEYGPEGETYGKNVCEVWSCGPAPEEEIRPTTQWTEIRTMIEDGCTDLEICQVYPQEGMRCRNAIRNYRLMWDRAHADWRHVEVTYIHGKTGSGKTRLVTDKYGYPNVYRITDYKRGPWETYDGQDVVLFEEFRSSFRLEEMLNYLDGHPVELECRYANQLAKFTKVYIVTNIPMEEQYPSFQDTFAREGMRNSWDALQRRISKTIKMDDAYNGQIETV